MNGERSIIAGCRVSAPRAHFAPPGPDIEGTVVDVGPSFLLVMLDDGRLTRFPFASTITVTVPDRQRIRCAPAPPPPPAPDYDLPLGTTGHWR